MKTLSTTALHFAFNLTLSDVSNGAGSLWKISPHIRESGLRNPIDFCSWNPESKLQWQSQESSTWNPKSTAWNPESKTVLYSLTWGGRFFREGYSLVKGALSLNSAKDKDFSLVSHRRPSTSAINPRLHSISVFFSSNRCIIHHPRFHAFLDNYLLERLRVITSSTKGFDILNRNSRVILDQNSTFNEKK